jgi:YidC/Oxa1 family membrane protein insertase
VNDGKNLILALALSALVLLGWSWASERFFPQPKPPATKVVNGKPQPLPQQSQAQSQAQSQPQPQATPAATPAKALQPRSKVLASTPRVRIVTPSLQGSLNLKGAPVDDLVLVRQRET